MKTPKELAEERMQLAYDHARLGERLVEIKKLKAKGWIEIRELCKSTAEADRKWDATDLGIEEMEIRAKMKSKEIRMSAIKTHIDVLNMEAFNHY